MRWSGGDLKNLLEKPIDELAKIYPTQNRKNLIRRKQEYTRKLRAEVVEYKSNPEDRVLRKTWTASAYDKENGEWVTTENHSWEHPSSGAFEYQAEPANITPLKDRATRRPYKTIGVFGDAQIGYRRVLEYATGEETLVPTHDERAMRVTRMLFRATRPDTIVNVGDNIDLAELSHFAPDSDQFYRTLAPAFQRVHDYYGELRADNPKARIVEVASNHNERLAKYVLKLAGAFYGLTQANGESKYPVLSYPHLANLEHVGVEWISGYPSGEFVYGEEYNAPPIVFRHGTETNSATSSAASKTMKAHPETHNVQGHAHSDSEAWHTLRDGRTLGSFVLGCLCRTDGVVPSYHNAVSDTGLPVRHQENWQQSAMIVRDHRNGDYEFIRIPIHDGTAYFEGKVYQADE